MQSESPNHRIFQRLDSTARFPYALSWYVRRTIWVLVDATLFRWSFPRSESWRRFVLRCFGAKLSHTCKIKRSARVKHPWLLEMGEFSVIAEDVDVYNLGPIRIGHHSVVSHRATLCAGTHDYTKPNLPLQRPPIDIGDGVWVCSQAFIGPGVRVGHNAMVGACAVVMKDVPDGMIVAGNPAKVIKPRPMDEAAPQI
jgi:putative colanic acid biosynthesis acetyltransferase WcaF